MEHLGAVVRHLGRLAVMQLRDEPCVGHQARIGREDARDVLPQHDAPGAERAREQRRRQVRPAAAERRHAAVRCLPDEAGDDGDRAGRHERADAPPGEPRRGREVGRGAAVMAVGDDDLGGIDIGRAPAPAGSAPRRRSAPTSARRARRAGRSPAGRGARARRWRRRARGTRAPRARSSSAAVACAAPAGRRPSATSRCRRRKVAAALAASALRPEVAAARLRAAGRSRPPSADATMTSGPPGAGAA